MNFDQWFEGAWHSGQFADESKPSARFVAQQGWDAALAQRAEALPQEPTYAMLKALAGNPVILAANHEEELRQRYLAMLRECGPSVP